MENPNPEKDEFMLAYQTEISSVLSQRDRIVALLAPGSKETRSFFMEEVALRIEFQYGYAGKDYSGLKDFINNLGNSDSTTQYDETIGLFVENTRKSVDQELSPRLFQLGRRLRTTILEVIPKNSNLRESKQDFTFFVSLVLYEILASRDN